MTARVAIHRQLPLVFRRRGFATCLTYTNRVYASGTLTRQVFPGPPGYEICRAAQGRRARRRR